MYGWTRWPNQNSWREFEVVYLLTMMLSDTWPSLSCYKSIHPSMTCHLFRAKSPVQQAKQGRPDVPLPSNVFHPLLAVPKPDEISNLSSVFWVWHAWKTSKGTEASWLYHWTSKLHLQRWRKLLMTSHQQGKLLALMVSSQNYTRYSKTLSLDF